MTSHSVCIKGSVALALVPAGGSSLPNLYISGDVEMCEGLQGLCSPTVSPSAALLAVGPYVPCL